LGEPGNTGKIEFLGFDLLNTIGLDIANIITFLSDGLTTDPNA
jgi:hypothetical protein